MKRKPQLLGLSSEHHQGLVMARKLSERASGWAESDAAAFHRRFETELEPHFRTEEEVLLPALRRAGRADLADRTLDEHASLRALDLRASDGDGDAARRLGEQLANHIRFEERALFPVCEALLPDGVLDEVARRAPKEK
jgi:hemerythrin-like domain-containing protein